MSKLYQTDQLPFLKLMQIKCLDGNKITASVAHALSEAFFVYPITPSTSASEHVEKLVFKGEVNIFGKVPVFEQMQSEAGSIAACHGASHANIVPTTFTSSQGLLLMKPNIIKMSGERRPAVIHVASRTLATHTLSIFGDHQDVMQFRSSGAIIISSANQQECQFNATLSYLIAKVLNVPVIHFYDGFQTSHEVQSINVLNNKQLKTIYYQFIQQFKLDKQMKNQFQVQLGNIGLISNDDTNFQLTEALKKNYNKFSEVIAQIQIFLQKQFDSHKIPTNSLFQTTNKNCKHLIVAMGSACDVIKDYITCNNNKQFGLLQIGLFRPFDEKSLLQNLQQFKNLETITVMDRNRELSNDEVLYSDIATMLYKNKKNYRLYSGVYGLSSKELRPEDVASIFQNAVQQGKQQFTIGIDDDIDQLNLKPLQHQKFTGTQVKLLARGSDGFVSASEALTKYFAQQNNSVQKMSYFDAKKSGGLTETDIRIKQMKNNKNVIIPAHYKIKDADLLFVSSQQILDQYPSQIKNLKPNGILLLISEQQGDISLNSEVYSYIKENNIKIFAFDAEKYKNDYQLQQSTKTNYEVIQVICDILKLDIKFDEAYTKLTGKSAVNQFSNLNKYLNKVKNIHQQVQVDQKQFGKQNMDTNIQNLMNKGEGNKIPVSAFLDLTNNPIFPNNTAQHHRPNNAKQIPLFTSQKCIECGKCSAVCPHGVIQTVLLNESEIKEMALDKSKLHKINNNYYYITISSQHCTGCQICAKECPTKALNMVENNKLNSDFCQNLYDQAQSVINTSDYKQRLPKSKTISQKSTQFSQQPLKCHSACSGCGQVGYIAQLAKVYQQQSKQLNIIQGTGCPLVYLGQLQQQCFSSQVFWNNSLFEDTTEVGFGLQRVLNKPVWSVVGDGSATDINFSGLDFSIQSGANTKVLVLDNNGYANTGGQRSSASLPGTVMKLASNKISKKPKDLIQMMMTYQNSYIATISNHNIDRTLQILKEADNFDGPALIIAYSPCITHGAADFSAVQMMRNAVDCGVFPLIRYDPRKEPGKQLQIDSEKTQPVTIMKEKRIIDHQILQQFVDDKWVQLKKLQQVF